MTGHSTSVLLLVPRSCFSFRPSISHRKGHSSPLLSAHVYCGQRAEWTEMPLGTEVGLGLGDIALDGDPALSPPKKKESGGGTAPVTEVGLGPGHIVLDGDPAPHPKRGTTPNFRLMTACLLLPKDWLGQDATW